MAYRPALGVLLPVTLADVDLGCDMLALLLLPSFCWSIRLQYKGMFTRTDGVVYRWHWWLSELHTSCSVL